MTFPYVTSLIARQAWIFMERDPISSLGDDSPEAIDIANFYLVALRTVLARVDWSFASRRRQFNAAAVDPFPDPDLPYLYALPDAEVITPREVLVTGAVWRVDDDGLRCDCRAPLPIRYTGMITNEQRLPAAVQTCVARQLGILLGPYWLKTASKLETLKQDLERGIKQAAREDARSAAQMRYDDHAPAADWVAEARL